jgi:hypothetical protein
MKFIIIVLSIALFISSCEGQSKRKSINKTKAYGGTLSTPFEAELSLDSTLVINQFNEDNVDLLKQYLSGNSRWEIRKEKKYRVVNKEYIPYEVTYAIRKEKRNKKYETTLNGYYSDFGENAIIHQTRVLISFGDYYGHGNDSTHITYASYPIDNKIKTIIEAEHTGTPGNSSYLIIKGKFINIEIYEQSKKLERTFSIKTINELNNELSMVLDNQQEIRSTGRSPIESYYSNKIDSTYYQIENGIQPGIYRIKAGLRTKEKGTVYIKAYNVATNERLSAQRMTPRTTRELGWSENGTAIFPYESELTVYEGDWANEYKARFEIWFRSTAGTEIKLMEKERIINGWQR